MPTRSFLWKLRRRLLNRRRRDYPQSSPFISGDDFRAACDFVFDDHGLTFLPSQVWPGALVFVKAYPPLVDYFFRQIHPRIRNPYRLLTHNEDRAMPGKHERFLGDEKLLHWYSTNISCRHPKLTSIPIGILNRRGSEETAGQLQRLIDERPAQDNLVYMNFHIGGETERQGYREHRQQIYDHFVSCDWVTRCPRVPTSQYLADIARHKFVISPPGHGPDCFRHWEAMYLGTIPIVEYGTNMGCYKDYPLLLIDDWSEVTPEWLEANCDPLHNLPFDRRKLFFPYWKERINGSKSAARR